MNLPKAYTSNVTKRAIDLTISVNPLGCSPMALRALKTISTKDISRYPDQTELKQLIAKKFNIKTTNVLLGNGSEQLIKLASLAFTKPGNTVFVESGSFFLFSRESMLARAEVKFFNFESLKKSLQKPSLLFIANPTTPGGIDRTNTEILAVINKIKPKIAIVDEANGEFRTQSMVSEINKSNNIIVLRTFSKALGLAGLRIGIAIGDTKLIGILNKFQQPFPITTPALVAAKAALKDDEFLRKTLQFIAKERAFLIDELKKRSFVVSNSITNNLFVSRPENERIITSLDDRGVSVINGSFFPDNKTPGFRISIKDKKQIVYF
jgi:histidinol-phosphate aminotransferase